MVRLIQLWKCAFHVVFLERNNFSNLVFLGIIQRYFTSFGRPGTGGGRVGAVRQQRLRRPSSRGEQGVLVPHGVPCAVWRKAWHRVQCNNSAFGDPRPGAPKEWVGFWGWSRGFLPKVQLLRKKGAFFMKLMCRFVATVSSSTTRFYWF